MGKAIIVGGGSQTYPIYDHLRYREIYGQFTTYVNSGAAAPNPIGLSSYSTYSTFNSLEGYFTIDSTQNRITVNKSIISNLLCYADSSVASSVVLKDSSGSIIFNSGDMAAARFNNPIESGNLQLLPGYYIEFRNGDDSVVPTASCYKTVIITKEASV